RLLFGEAPIEAHESVNESDEAREDVTRVGALAGSIRANASSTPRLALARDHSNGHGDSEIAERCRGITEYDAVVPNDELTSLLTNDWLFEADELPRLLIKRRRNGYFRG